MRVAIDIQPNPPDVPKSLPAAGVNAVTLFYFCLVILCAYGAVAVTQHVRIHALQAQRDGELADYQSQLNSILAEGTELARRTAVATELSEWLALAPPTQALLLALTQEVEPNVAFSKIQVDLDPGQPTARVSVEITTPSEDAATRQVASVQAALEHAGFRGINVDKDEPTPEGRRFMTTVALPVRGDFSQLGHPGGGS